MTETILDDIEEQARARPDHPALVTENGEDLSYGALADRIKHWTERFTADGIRNGDLCGFMASPGPTYIAAALGIMDAGGVLVPIPEEHREKSDSLYFEKLALDWVIDEKKEFTPHQRNHSEAERPWNDPDLDPAYVRFTSGTTGDQKGVLLGHESIRERTEIANRTLSISPDDRILWLLSMDHHLVVSILLYLRNGATILLPEHTLAGPVLSFADRHDATVLYATPYHYRMLTGADQPGALSSLRMAISTAEELPVETARDFDETYDQPVSQGLGIIEVGLPAVNLQKPREKPESVGPVRPEYEVTLLDDDDEPVTASGERTGELHIDGPGLFDAYLHPWKPREEVCGPYGFPTGDQARLDADGDLYLVGRRTNRINRAGNKFFCEEVEQVLNRHPDVRESRVYGKSHPKLGELPYAQIVPTAPEAMPSGSELNEHCRDHLAEYKIPRSFEQVSELPRTPTGKIKRDGPEARD